jgi:thiamine biosynthesis lipoprotein
MTTEPAAVGFPALGTTAWVLVTDPAVLDAARAAVQAEVAAIDAACSRFRDDSELALVNAAGGQAVPVSPLLLDALEVALRAAVITDGLVDPTVGAVLRDIGYDRDFAAVPASGPPLRATVRTVPGWRAVDVDRRRGTVRVPAGVALDLGATAKAWCADRAASAAAEAAGGAGVLVSLGGDIAVAGPPPGEGWAVRVTDDHRAPTDAPGQTVVLGDGGLATSGTASRRWTRGAAQLHHLIDPATAAPAAGEWRTVTVAAASCVDANIASTAAVVLGAGAPAWLTGFGLPARLVAEDGTVTLVGDWPADEHQPHTDGAHAR